MVKLIDLSGGQNKKHAFCALLSRMKYIKRWSLMRNTRAESLSEHVVDGQIVAHILCLLAKQDGHEVREGEVNLVYLYHDVSEIITGDMPSPIKYKREALRDLYKQLEEESALSLLEYLPEDVAKGVEPYITGEQLTDVERTIVKCADVISGMIKCIEEHQVGNMEFEVALQRTYQKIQEMGFKPAIKFVELYIFQITTIIWMD